MIRAMVLDFWTTDEVGTNVPSLLLSHCANVAISDVSYQLDVPTDPNICAWIIECDEAVLAAIIADPEYGEGAILWSETI